MEGARSVSDAEHGGRLRLSRRALLRLGLGGLVGLPLLRATRALAFGKTSELVFALLDHGEGSDPRPTALRRLAWEVISRTSIEAELTAVTLAPDSPKLFYHPLTVLAGADGFKLPDAAGIANLRRFLTYGGMLLIDSSEGGDGSPFDQSVRALMQAVLPDHHFEQVPRDHVIYKSFYLLDDPTGRVLRKPYLEGIQIDGRFAVVYSENDLLGAFARDDLGMWRFDVEPQQRENAFRLGVNLVMYATCLDYKDDQVHLPFILRRRKS
jgi:hypothetical protein